MASTPKTDQTLKFESAFLAPRFWPTWLLMGLIWLSSSLPRPVTMKLGNALGQAFKLSNKKRQRIVTKNLQLCFAELTQSEREALADRHYQYYGRSILDLGLSWWAPVSRLQKLITFKGEAAYLNTVREHNVIVILPHFTGIDCGAGFAGRLTPSISMMKAQSNPLFTWLLWRGRTRFKPSRVIMRHQGLRPLIKATKKGVACFYLPDQDFGDTSLTVFAPFFGHARSTLITLSKMAKMADAKVVLMLPRMRDDGSYEVEFKPPLENFPSGDEEQDATAVNAAIEQAIRQAPAQYMWTLQWFKSRPDNQPSPYL